MVGTQQLLLHRLPNEIAISFLGKVITPICSARDLRIILDNNLTYDQHIHQITSLCMAQLCQINRVKSMLHKIKWLLVNEHLHYRDTVMAFRCIKSLAPTFLCESFRKRKCIHYHNTRNSQSLDILPSKTKSGRAVNISNNLDKDFKQLSLTSFKKS